MKKMTANEIRNTWLSFFKAHGHDIAPGASLVPHNDPTLLWINSGVAALKKYFDGSEIPHNRRITNVQKSIRTNDIENVGKTARHHTFFEMLGNFSIGDYFRDEVIPWAYELLTSPKYFGFDIEKLYFTYQPQDLATKKLWLSLGIKEEKLVPVEDNFWQIGEGPCGPNTEIFFDRGEKYDPQGIGDRLLREDLENDRYIEIWNIVFSQYNAVEGVARENYKELPKKNIDTGAGLERLACVLQETETNFETDLFYPIIEATVKMTGVPYAVPNLMPYRVIADHIRTCTFALSDGATFSNEGRGYVLRRIIRRAMRYGRKIGMNEPFLYRLVDVVSQNMANYYRYLQDKVAYVSKMILTEEEKFLRTLNSGESMLRKMIEGSTLLSGEDAFKLYDTYGFPIELTKEICEENHVQVDIQGFNTQMKAQRERARLARSTEQSMNRQSKDLLEFTVSSTFTYGSKPIQAKVVGLFKDGIAVDTLDESGEVVFDQTVFYAESGGQVCDQGRIYTELTEADVTQVSKAPHSQHLHHVEIKFGVIKLGDVLTLEIDEQKRRLTMRNHSATHFLQKALTEVLGDDLHQAGSYVSDEYLRFDFNYSEKVKEDQLDQIERKVNEYIAQAIEQKTLILPIEEAKNIGAKALFDEKYGDVVRVVTFGDVTKEFCGGTHVSNSQDIGAFVIESEGSIAAGIRRIQGRTSLLAYKWLKGKERLFNEARDLLGANSIYEVSDRIKSALAEKEALKKENRALLEKEASLLSKSLKDEFSVYNGYHTLVKHLPNLNRDQLTKLMDTLKTIHADGVIVLTGNEEEKIPLVVSVGEIGRQNGLKAGNLVKEISALLGGSGGGRPDFASGAGKDKEKLDQVLPLLKRLVN
ncbi:MAG: alanine--tRNA ligase [Methanomicrobia archaeon]|nr:alanine--tRNA ligase [Methanomicrobia archaeon]